MARKKTSRKGGAKRREAKDKPEPAASAVDQHEKQHDLALYLAFLGAKRDGREPTREQVRGAKRWEKAHEEERRWQYYPTIPKAHWCSMAGRPHYVLNRQAQTYDIRGLDGAVVDLPVFVHWFHNFLAIEGRKLLAPESDGALLFGDTTPNMERLRGAKADLAEMQRDREKGMLIARDEIRARLTELGDRLRKGGETLKRRCGDEAHAIHNEMLEDFERHVMKLDNKQARSTGREPR